MIITRLITSDRTIPWLEVGYELFIREGHYGIQIERLARVLGRNKSAFYHFFGNKDTYMEFLFKYHLRIMDSFIDDAKAIEQYDPQYIDLQVKYQRLFLFNCQLVKNGNHLKCHETLQKIYAYEEAFILPIWSKYVGLEEHHNISKRLFSMSRDVMYMRLKRDRFTYDYLCALSLETKNIVSELIN